MYDVILESRNRFTWALLAMQGGFVNVGGLLATHKFVSHITGFAAHFAIELTKPRYFPALMFAVVPLFFLLGSFFSGLFTEARRKRGENPNYIQILLLLSTVYASVALLGYWGFLGYFGDPFEDDDFLALGLLAFSCGAQNALFTNYSNSIIRTTHLTGITTDLGIGLARVLINRDSKEAKINRLRIDLIIAFLIGSVAGSVLFTKFTYLAFLVPTFVSLGVGLRLYRSRLQAESQ